MYVVATLRLRLPGFMLPADVVVALSALSARLPLNLLLPADVVAAKIARSKMKKAVSAGRMACYYHWPYC